MYIYVTYMQQIGKNSTSLLNASIISEWSQKRGDCWSPIYQRWWNVEFLNHPTASFSTSKKKWRNTIWNISCEQHPVVNVCLLDPCCATNEVQRPGDITWRFTNGSPQLLSSMLNDVDETFCSKSSISFMKELIESDVNSAANTLAGPLSERLVHYQKQRRLIFMLSFVFQLVLKIDHQHIWMLFTVAFSMMKRCN